MARIRSIKPEFWTDGSNLKLSDSCALFFIGLWNFCDDEGKHRLSLEQVCAELGGRWRKDKVRLFLVCLAKTGQIRISLCTEWLQITGWSHQKIDKPRQPEIKTEDLQWLGVGDSTKALERSRNVDARIGEDRILEDRIGSEGSAPPKRRRKPKPLVPANAGPDPVKELNGKIWEAYSEAYFDRYKTSPIRNRTVNSQIKALGERLGADAPEVVRFYVRHDKSYYVGRLHAIGLCLADAEPLRTQWFHDRPVTQNDIRHFEQQSAMRDLNDKIERGEI